MRSVPALLGSLLLLLPCAAVAVGPTATVPALDALAAERSCAGDPDCLAELLPPHVEVDPATGAPLLQVRIGDGVDPDPLHDWASAWPGVELQQRRLSGPYDGGFEVDLWMDLLEVDAWTDLSATLVALSQDGEVVLAAAPIREPGVRPDLAGARAEVGACGGQLDCLRELRRLRPWLDPEEGTAALEIELVAVDQDDPRIEDLVRLGWREPPMSVGVEQVDGERRARLAGRLELPELEALLGRFDLCARPIDESDLSPARMGLGVADAAADVAACGGEHTCLFEVAIRHTAKVSPQGLLGVRIEGESGHQDTPEQPGWQPAPDDPLVGLIELGALRELVLGRWLPGAPVDVLLDRTDQQPEDEADWLDSWKEGEVDPHGDEGDEDQPSDGDPLADDFADLWPDLDLAEAHPGLTTGLTLPWSSLDPYTLDGELVEELVAGAAGDERVIDGVFTHTIPIPVPGGRGGLAPSVAITFADRADGWLGRHWLLVGLPSIERDRFGDYRAGGARLVEVPDPTPIAGAQGYRTEHDDGGLYFRSGGLWSRTEAGTTLEYGAIEGLCGAYEQAPRRWWICREQDPHGNSVLYEYDESDGIVRPGSISWGQSLLSAPQPDQPGTDRDLALHFTFDVVRPDSRLRFNGDGWATDDMLLGSIELSGGPGGRQLIRRWELDYDVARPSNTPLLAEVQVVGTDGVTSQRLRQLRYHHEWGDAVPIDQVAAPSGHGFDDGVAWTDATNISDQFPGTEGLWSRTVRLNHDALPDVVFFDIDPEWTDGDAPICMTEGSCTEAPCSGGLPACYEPGDPQWSDLCASPGTVRAFVNVGDLQFVEDPEAAAVIADWMDEQPPPDSTPDAYFGQLQFIDLNGDGMDDLVGPETILLSQDVWDWRVYRTSFWLNQGLPGQPNPFGVDVLWVDVNGDGLTDAVMPPQDQVEEVVADVPGHPGGLCVLPPDRGANGSPPDWMYLLNRTAGQTVAAEVVPFPLEVPLFDDELGDIIWGDVMDLPIMQVADSWTELGCEVGGVPGTLIPGSVLTLLDNDEAALAAALSGWSYLANHVQFVDANTDGCADVAISMELGPLFDRGAMSEYWLTDWVEVPGHISTVAYGDCQGSFSPIGDDVELVERHLGWPGSRVRNEHWYDDGHVTCSAAPFGGRALSTVCGEPMHQPWVMKECNPSPSEELCCSRNGCNQAVYEVCESWQCAAVDPSPNSSTMYDPDPDELLLPPGGLDLPAWSDDLVGGPEPWDPMLGYRLSFGVDAYERRPGGSFTPTPGGQFSDLDGDGRLEWLQSCTRQGHTDPLDPSFAGGPAPSSSDLKPMLATHPLAAWFPADANTIVPIDGGVPVACEAAAARATGIEWLGALVANEDQNTPPVLNQDVASLLVDLDGDGFVDQLLVDGTGDHGNPRWSVRRQLRSAPELSLRAITYPSGEYPEATAHLSWAALPPTENPNLPFVLRDVVEIIDGNGHRVFKRGQCRVTDGESVGCSVVVGQSSRGAFHKALYTTARAVPGRRWLSAVFDSDGRIEDLSVSLIAGLDPAAGIDDVAPFENRSWRNCGYRLDGSGFDPSLEGYVQACLEWDSPYVVEPGLDIGDLWLDQGQLARTWPYAVGLLGQAVQLPGVGPLMMDPTTEWELFPTTSLFDPLTGRPEQVFTEQYASTPEDDLRSDLDWSQPAPGHGPRLDGTTSSNAWSSEVYGDVSWGFDGWTRVSTTRVDGVDTISSSRLPDDFGRTDVAVSPTGGETVTTWHWCGGPDRVTDPVGRFAQTLWSSACEVEGSATSQGMTAARTLDAFGLPLSSQTDPGSSDPPLVSRAAVDRDPSHYGHFAEVHPPQRATTDGRTLSRRWLDVRGRVWKSATCAAGPIPPVGAPPSSYGCLPSTEVQALTVHAEDGRIVGKTRPHAPGSTPVWTLVEYDDLGRAVASGEALGSFGAVLGPGPSASEEPPQFGPITAVAHLPDGVQIDHPGGVEEQLIHAPLEELRLLDGQVVLAVSMRADGRELEAVDVAGRTRTLSYDGFGRVQQEDLPDFYGVDATTGSPASLSPTVGYGRDEASRVTSFVDARGVPWTRGYDEVGRRILLEGPPNAGPDRVAIERTEYIDSARLIHSWDADDSLVEVEVDGLGRAVRTSYPDGTQELRSYDVFGGVSTVTDRRGLQVTPTVSWEPGGQQRVEIAGSDGAVTVHYAGPDGRPLRQVDADGVASDVEYDDWGRPVRWRLGAASPYDITTWPDGQVQLERGYDERSLPSWECPYGTSSGQLCRTFEHTPKGQLAARHEGVDPAVVDDPASWSPAATWTWDWRDDGLLERSTDPLGIHSEYRYDDAGHAQEVIVDGVSMGQSLRDIRGEAVRSTSSVGDVTSVVLDDWGRLSELWAPGVSAPQTYGYHDDGMLRWTEDGDGQTTAFDVPADRWFTYDDANRLVTATSWNRSSHNREYAGADLVAEWTADPSRTVLSWSEYEHDARGAQVVSRSAISLDCAEAAAGTGSVLTTSRCAVADWGETSISWTAAGRRDLLVDPEGSVTGWRRDPLTGRLSDVITASTTTTLVRDPLGRLDKLVEGTVATARLSWDPMGRLESETWDVGGDVEELRFTYDALGRSIHSEVRRNGAPVEEEYIDYDALGRPTQLGQNLFGQPGPISPFNGVCDSGELCFDWRDDGLLKSVVYPDSAEVTYEYDGGRLDRVCEGHGCGGPKLYEVQSRDAVGRPTQTWREGDVWEETDWTRWGAPARVAVDLMQAGGPHGAATSIETLFGYDPLGRLETRDTVQVGLATLGDSTSYREYGRNAAGWLDREEIDGDVFTIGWDRAGNRTSRLDEATGDGWTATYGPDNRLDVWTDGASSTQLLYDGRGNRLNDVEGRSLSYSPRGRLERIVDGSGNLEAEYAYGVRGRRVAERTGSDKRAFQYGPGAFLPWVVSGSSGDTDQVLAGGSLLATISATGDLSTVSNLGTAEPMLQVDKAGAPGWQGSWDAWGSPVQADGAAPAAGFGGMLDTIADVPFLAAAARDYDPTTGTWLQMDPLGVDGGLNVYRYAEGDPVSMADPSGLCVDVTPQDEVQQQIRDMFWKRLKAEGVIGKSGRPRRMEMMGPCAASPDPAECTRQQGSHEYFEEAWEQARQRRRQAQKFAAELGMSGAEWHAAVAGNSKLVDQMVRLESTLGEYGAAQGAWLALGGVAITLGLEPADGAEGVFMDTPAAYMTGRIPSRHLANAVASNGLGFLGDSWDSATHDGPVYLANFDEEVQVWGQIQVGSGPVTAESLAWFVDDSILDRWSASPIDSGNGEFGIVWDPRDLEATPADPFHGITPDQALLNAVTTAPVDAMESIGLTYAAMTGPATPDGVVESLRDVSERWREACRVVKPTADQRETMEFMEDHYQMLGLLLLDIGPLTEMKMLGVPAGAINRWWHVRGSPTTWNDFQAATRGRYGANRSRAGRDWRAYRDEHGLGPAPTTVADGPGQVHHLLSAEILDALDNHPTLSAVFVRDDPRLMRRAADLESHYGYQDWHRQYDANVSDWLRRNPDATPQNFLDYLDAVHAHEDMMSRFGVFTVADQFGFGP